MSDTKLKPCPFCGGEAKIRHNGSTTYIECENSKCNLVSTQRYWNENQAIEAWNTRKPIDKVVEQLEELSDEANDKITISHHPQYYDGYEDGLDKAIEIVNQELTKI